MTRRSRRWRMSAVAALMCVAAQPALGTNPPREPTAAELMDDLMWGRGAIGGPFALTDHTGRLRSDADFRGKLLLVYFGYTFCPDICPTDLQVIAAAIDSLGASGEHVQPLFITVDPERDAPAALAQYVGAFHPRLVGLTGGIEDIRRIARAYKAWFAKVEDPRMTATIMEHSSYIYLVDTEGRYVGFFPPGTPPERLAKAIAPLLPSAR